MKIAWKIVPIAVLHENNTITIFSATSLLGISSVKIEQTRGIAEIIFLISKLSLTLTNQDVQTLTFNDMPLDEEEDEDPFTAKLMSFEVSSLKHTKLCYTF